MKFDMTTSYDPPRWEVLSSLPVRSWYLRRKLRIPETLVRDGKGLLVVVTTTGDLPNILPPLFGRFQVSMSHGGTS